MCGAYDPIAAIYRPFLRPSRDVKNSAGNSGSTDGVQQKITSALRTSSFSRRPYSPNSGLMEENLISFRHWTPIVLSHLECLHQLDGPLETAVDDVDVVNFVPSENQRESDVPVCLFPCAKDRHSVDVLSLL